MNEEQRLNNNKKGGDNMKKFIGLLLIVIAITGCAAKEPVGNPPENGEVLSMTSFPQPVDNDIQFIEFIALIE